MIIENWVGAVCVQFGVYFALYAMFLRERELHHIALEGWAASAGRAKALAELSVQFQGENCRLLSQRDKLASLARCWVPNDDNGHSCVNSLVLGKAPTHVVDRILAE